MDDYLFIFIIATLLFGMLIEVIRVIDLDKPNPDREYLDALLDDYS